MSNQLQQLTLEEVKLHFEQWRANKKRGGRIPEELWREIRVIEQFYKPSRICTTLGISGQQYKKILLPQEKPSTFVDVSTNIKSAGLARSTIKSIETNGALVEIQRNDGARLSITHLSQDAISHVIHNFLAR